MTTLSLTDAFVAPVSDLSDTVSVGQYAETSDDAAMVEVRRYAGGRDRVISAPGASVSVSVSFRYISRSDYLDLLGLVGQLVLFRDQRGRRVFGVFGNLAATEFSVRDLLENVSFTVSSSTVSEIV